MQYGLTIMPETQLSHKTNSGQMTEIRGQKLTVKGQRTGVFNGGFRNGEGGIQ
jgi:hypothetical protein